MCVCGPTKKQVTTSETLNIHGRCDQGITGQEVRSPWGSDRQTHAHTHTNLSQPAWIIAALFYWHSTSEYIPSGTSDGLSAHIFETTVLIYGHAQCWHHPSQVLAGDRALLEPQPTTHAYTNTQTHTYSYYTLAPRPAHYIILIECISDWACTHLPLEWL